MFCRNIKRTKIKNEGPRQKSSPESEPDFYRMPNLDDVLKMEVLKKRRPLQLMECQRSGQSPAAACSTHDLRDAVSALLPPPPSISAQVSLLLSHRLKQQRLQDQLPPLSLLASSTRRSLLHPATRIGGSLGDCLTLMDIPLCQSKDSFPLLRDHLSVTNQQQSQRSRPIFSQRHSSGAKWI